MQRVKKKLLDIIIPHRLTPRKWFLSVSYLVWIEFRGFFEVFKKIKIASQKYRKLYPRKKLMYHMWINPVGKIAEKAVGRIFDNMALYFECRINKNLTPSDCFFWRFCPLGRLMS